MIAKLSFESAAVNLFNQDAPEKPPASRPKSLRAKRRPILHVGQIVAWARAHFERTGEWPMTHSGPIYDDPRETWQAMDSSLREGCRGLPGGSSLARFLQEHLNVRNQKRLPPYTVAQILEWADSHRRRTGSWPRDHSGPIEDAPGETWRAVDGALRFGVRGLPGGSSLPRLLHEHRGVRNNAQLSPLTEHAILQWADLHHQRHGRWPTHASGIVEDAPGETWSGINASLAVGNRGLLGESSLVKLLSEHRGKRNHLARPRLTVRQILHWARLHFARTGHWPHRQSGKVDLAPEETWCAIHNALRQGRRGLRPHGSLAKLLAKHCGVRNIGDLPPLSVEQILNWADSHFQRTGRWPTQDYGPVTGAEGEKWRNISDALRHGLRGLPGGSSLSQLLDQHRRIR